MNGYQLSRQWWGFAFDTKEVKPIHSALYFLITEHCNRLGQKPEFGFPSSIATEGLGVTYKTYKGAFDDLVKWGFVKVVQASKNQYSANIIALVNFTEATTNATTRAIDKATANATTNSTTEQLPKHFPHNRTKEQKTQISKEQKNNEGDLVFPFTDENFMQMWDHWKAFRKENGWKAYKHLGAQAALRKIGKIADTSEEACAVIEQSMENGWKGLFEIKQSKNGTHQRSNQQTRQELAREFAEEYIREQSRTT